MNNYDITKELGLVLGPIFLFLYLWMVIRVFRDAKHAEDETAIKRFKQILLVNGGMFAVAIPLFARQVYSEYFAGEHGLGTLQLVYEVTKQLSLLLCFGIPIAFLNTFIMFRRLVPWFWKN